MCLMHPNLRVTRVSGSFGKSVCNRCLVRTEKWKKKMMMINVCLKYKPEQFLCVQSRF